jgi:serine/threonine-protein kinase
LSGLQPASLADSDDELRGNHPHVPLPLDVALRITLDLLGGLHAAHELTDKRGRPLHIVHRDVSPANVLVGSDGISRITDFGVARAEARLASTHGKVLKGKVPYLSPEQISADQVDRRSDVYSAATVLWEMLTGRRLFHAQNEGAVLNMVTQGTRTRPSELNPEVPSPVDVVCMRALNVDPGQRFSSATVFSDALEEVAEMAGVQIATSRRAASYVGQFETNLARLRATESMMHIELGVPASTLLPGHSAGAADGSGSHPSVSSSAQRVSVSSVGGTPSGAVLDASTMSASMMGTSNRGRVAALLAGAAAVIAGGILSLVVFGGDEPESRRGAAGSAVPPQYGAAGPDSAASVAERTPASPASAPLAVASSEAGPPVDAGVDGEDEPEAGRPAGRGGARRGGHRDPLPSEFLPKDL